MEIQQKHLPVTKIIFHHVHIDSKYCDLSEFNELKIIASLNKQIKGTLMQTWKSPYMF